MCSVSSSLPYQIARVQRSISTDPFEDALFATVAIVNAGTIAFSAFWSTPQAWRFTLALRLPRGQLGESSLNETPFGLLLGERRGRCTKQYIVEGDNLPPVGVRRRVGFGMNG